MLDIHRFRVDFDRELIVRLISELLIFTFRSNYDARVQIGSQRVDRYNRCCKIHDVQAAHQFCRQARVLEYCNDTAAFLANVDRRRRVTQRDHNPAAAAACATEVNARDRAAACTCIRGPGSRRCGTRELSGHRATLVFNAQCYHYRVTAAAHFIRYHRIEIQHDARAAVCLSGQDSIQWTEIDVPAT